tara:strand:+ start:5717 stop:6178 length:462 start_codon:yes stop_codon:yes gene_type:complete
MELKAGKILGSRELKQAFNKIPYEVKKSKLWMAVMRAAAKPIIEGARANINDDEGQLRKSIKAFNTRASRRLPALYVGPKATGGKAKENEKRGGGFYGAMVEYGTATAQASPFMRPAWESKQGQSEQILLKGAEQIVAKILLRETKGLKRIYT